LCIYIGIKGCDLIILQGKVSTSFAQEAGVYISDELFAAFARLIFTL
jgi:hypothetical protein